MWIHVMAGALSFCIFSLGLFSEEECGHSS
jgi:hypothetical protein